MNVLTPKEMYNLYKIQAERLLPEETYHTMVSTEKQEREIELLKETIHYERFFFVINLRNLNIEHTHGIERWLGYSDKDFSIMKFLSIIHPAQINAHHITATTLFEGLMRGDWKIEFMKHRYITTIALQHRKGHYLLCKRLAGVFQYDKNSCLLEYVNEFTIVGEYKEEPYSIRAFNDDGSRLQWMEEVLKRIREAFENEHLFSFQELRILRKYAYNPTLTFNDIAATFKIKESTVITYKKRIIEKAAQLFNKQFQNAKQVALVLKEQGML